ncbi:AAA family ATPase [Intestinibacter sp.]|uniref:AAA family ATPase n=1 Tax=Intestinibacter sp. TaxID=1965304 RepID=UPI003AB45997
MRINSIKLKDFRQYYGEQELNFQGPSDKNINIILGQNGEGKTGIFRAVIFALFGQSELSGEEKNTKKNRNKDIIHLVNFNKLEEEKDNSVEAYVEVTFEHKDQKYIIKRSIIEMKELDGSIITDDESSVEMTIIDSCGNVNPNKITDNEEVQNILSNILDKKLKDFFFFDGEKIENLSKPNQETRKEVKSGIIKLLQIDTITKAIELLGSMENKQNNKIKKNTSNTKLQSMKSELEQLQDRKQTLQNDKSNIENEIINCKELIKSYKEKLSQNQDIKKVYEDIDILEKTIEDKNQTLESINKRAQILLKDQGGNLLLEDYIISVKNFLGQDDIVNEYSIRITLDLIEEILNQGECICGHKFEIDSYNYKKLDELRYKYKKSELSMFVRDFTNLINEYYLEKDEKDEELKNLLKETDLIDDEIEKLLIRVNKLNETIKGYSNNETNLKQMEKDLSTYESKIKELENKRQNIIYNIENIDNKTKELDKKIKIEEKQEVALKNDVKKKDYITRLKKGFDDILDDYSSNMREKISIETTKTFKALISENDIDMVKNIVINHEYEIQVYGWNGKLITSDVSAGQRQIISLAFVTALAKVASGSQNMMNVPLFMDTPFGRISGVNRDNLIKYLPNLTKQWILLMTDTEFTRTEEREFKSTNKINNIYKLNKVKDGYTIIEKVEDIYNVSIARR